MIWQGLDVPVHDCICLDILGHDLESVNIHSVFVRLH